MIDEQKTVAVGDAARSTEAGAALVSGTVTVRKAVRVLALPDDAMKMGRFGGLDAEGHSARKIIQIVQDPLAFVSRDLIHGCAAAGLHQKEHGPERQRKLRDPGGHGLQDEGA